MGHNKTGDESAYSERLSFGNRSRHVVTAFAAVILALFVGRAILGSHAGLSFRSVVAIWNVIASSSIGALAGHELSVDLSSPPSSVLIGSMAGLLASILITCFAIEIFYLARRYRAD
jgi:ribose/xylose/arabinose/galactoside ABC-type transport system permease subunit